MGLPRTARASAAGYGSHVLNRGNGRAEVFHQPADYRASPEMIAQAQARLAMRVLGYCVMADRCARPSCAGACSGVRPMGQA